MTTIAVITGVTGQDGSYLAERLLSAGYEVHGVVRDDQEVVTPGVVVHRLDLEGHAAHDGSTGLGDLVRELRPDQIYNLAAVSSVAASWRKPLATARVNALAVAELLAATHDLRVGAGHETRVVQASTAEIFGMPHERPQTESTPIRPTSPYGAAKAHAHALVGAYRGAGGFASSLVLYSHESPRRPATFVTRKITSAAAAIARGAQDRLELGSLDVRRDWGWAPDYVESMQLAAEASEPGDFIIATGVSHSIREFAAVAFARAGVHDWADRIVVADEFVRSADAVDQVGDASRAHDALGWAPRLAFEAVVHAMVDHDLALHDAPSPS